MPTASGGPDRAVMARMFIYLYGLGGLLILLTLALPHAPGRDDLQIFIVAIAAILVSLGFLVLFDRTPLWVFRIAPGVGAVLIALLAYGAGGPTGAAAYLFFLFWVSLSSSYFFGLAEALANAVWAALTAAVALAARDDVNQIELLVTMVAGTMVVSGFVMVGLRYQLEVVVDRLDRAARTDFLTRLANRREFYERLEYELARAQRSGRPVSVVALDLDAFKTINDRFGHPAGDGALERVADILRDRTRRIDTPARIGGEEFALLVPDTGRHDAATLANRICEGVRQEFGDGYGLTVSAGVAGYPETGTSSEALMRAADRALYAAKSSGRDRVVVYVAEEPTDAPGEGADAQRHVPSPGDLATEG